MKSIKTEFIAGLTTFLTMSYVIIVNPSILSTPGTGLTYSGVLTATVVLSFAMTLLMGLYAKLPFAVAPGMGVNAFFTFTIILTNKVPWQTALGMVFWAGVFFLIISATKIRELIAEAIPVQLRISAAVGIGIFLTFLGLKNSGLITSDPVTFVKLGKIKVETLLSFAGLGVMLYFLTKKSSLAFLVGIITTTVLGIIFGFVNLPKEFFSMPDFKSTFFHVDFIGSLKLSLLPTTISILFTDLFDSISTFVGVSQAANLLDKNGNPKNLRQGLLVDSFATMFAGLFGTSSGTAYIESSAGIEVGGRTGLTSIFTALFFLPCLFIAPLTAMVPGFATAPVLVLVGLFMFKGVKELNLKNFEDALPAFLTIILIPLTFSITQGILWGFITHVLLYLFSGRRKEIKPMMYAIAAISIILLLIENI